LSGAAGSKVCDTVLTRQREDRAVLDDDPANGSRLCGRFAPLAGMTAGEAVFDMRLPGRPDFKPIPRHRQKAKGGHVARLLCR